MSAPDRRLARMLAWLLAAIMVGCVTSVALDMEVRRVLHQAREQCAKAGGKFHNTPGAGWRCDVPKGLL